MGQGQRMIDLAQAVPARLDPVVPGSFLLRCHSSWNRRQWRVPRAESFSRMRRTMHKVILAGLLATSLTAPVAAYAQPAAAPAAKPTDEVFVIEPSQWLAIGAGAVVGVVLMDVILPSNVAFIVGGVVGGYLANVWYGGREVQLQMTTVPKT